LLPILLIYTKVKVTIKTGLSTKWDMNINSRQDMLMMLANSFTFEIVHKVIAIWGFIILMLTQTSSMAQINHVCLISSAGTKCTQVSDSTAAIAFLKATIKEQRANHFLAASIDSISSKTDTLFAFNYVGKVYDKIVLKNHNFGKGFLEDSINVQLNSVEFNILQNQIITNYENMGYPFANIVLSEVELHGTDISCRATLFTYTKIVFDSIAIVGNSTISKKYLEKYLDIMEGSPYIEENVRDLDKRLRNLPLLKLKSASRVVFYQGLARVILDIDDVVTDRIDGVVGFAPNSANSEENKLLLTGEVNIELNNLFKSAKQLEIHWRNYLQRSQLLDLSFTYPYLFNTKLGINGELNINKFDTLFVNLKSKVSFRYQKKGNNYIQFYYQNINSNLITADTSQIRSTKVVPSNNPYNIDNYGFAIHQKDIDYLPNPRKGYSITIDAAIGQKTILRNTEIDLVKYTNTETGQPISIYDTIDKKSYRSNFSIEAAYYIPIKKSSTIKQNLKVMGLVTEQVFFNELYNFGGFSTLRGFDENELFASKALIYNLEYRYLLDQNSNVGLFVNTALVENLLEDDKLIYDTPIGFGVLANIKVGNGILNIAYALGKQLDNPIKLNSAKFHFGIVNYF
jgi:translocation and assembly module TamA